MRHFMGSRESCRGLVCLVFSDECTGLNGQSRKHRGRVIAGLRVVWSGGALLCRMLEQLVKNDSHNSGGHHENNNIEKKIEFYSKHWQYL